jgi:hypothetical protein
MSTVEQIEEAIRALPARERDRLARDLPKLLPELDGDAAWGRIVRDGRPRPALSQLLDEADVVLAEDPARLPETTDSRLPEGLRRLPTPCWIKEERGIPARQAARTSPSPRTGT